MSAGEGATVGPGDVVAEKYRVERVIGRGGMGVVVAAVHVELGNRVALKFLLPNALANKEAVTRFEREARAAVALQSDHVSRVLDVGRLPDGAPYIVMELLEGMDLAHELHRRGGRLPVAEATSYIVQACDAIAEAHALGIVHRDLKPSNLFLAKRAKKAAIVKVLDFGISKPTSMTASPTDLTGTADLIGSPLYMSPEQLRAPKTVDGRSDVWSLAATLFELVCGAPPFDGATMAELSAHILTAPTPDVRTFVPDAPEGFAEVIRRALEKEPAARIESVDAFAAALTPYATSLATATGASAPAVTPALTPPRVEHTLPLLPSPATAATPVSEPKVVSEAAVSLPKASPSSRSSGRSALIGAATVGAIAFAIFIGTRSGKRDDAKPAPAALVASSPASVSASAPPAPASIESAPVVASAPTPNVAGSAKPAPPRPSARPAVTSTASSAPSSSPSSPPSSSASRPKAIPMELNQ